MSAHTPGPWLFRGKCNSVYTAPPAGSGYTYGSIIFSFHDVAEPSDADLALVLAAPDLLEALESMLVVQYDGDPRRQESCDLCIAARAAIAKARGES